MTEKEKEARIDKIVEEMVKFENDAVRKDYKLTVYERYMLEAIVKIANYIKENY